MASRCSDQRRGVAVADATEIASVESAPLAQIVQHVLEVSDNEGAEVLFRQAAIGAGQAGLVQGRCGGRSGDAGGLGIDTRGGG